MNDTMMFETPWTAAIRPHGLWWKWNIYTNGNSVMSGTGLTRRGSERLIRANLAYARVVTVAITSQSRTKWLIQRTRRR